MDKEVLREVWHGQLPLCFRLHPDDVSDRVIKYFNRFMDQSKQVPDDMWLDYDGQAIKWQHPIGLSWDLYGSSYDLPWRLMIHFSDFPTKDLVRCNTKSSIKVNFMSSIKEADALKHKSSVTKNMLEKDQNQLWSSLVNNKFDQFWLINKRLMDRIDNELFRYIPFRLYFSDYTYVQKVVRPCTIEKPIFSNSDKSSRRISSSGQLDNIFDKDIVITKHSHKCGHSEAEIEEANKTDSGHRYSTMLDLIQTTFVNRLDDLLITSQTGDDLAKAGDNEGQKDKPDNKLIDVKLFKYRFLSHGIEIPFDAPLQWLSEHLSYPDNFLHICAISKSSSQY